MSTPGPHNKIKDNTYAAVNQSLPPSPQIKLEEPVLRENNNENLIPFSQRFDEFQKDKASEDILNKYTWTFKKKTPESIEIVSSTGKSIIEAPSSSKVITASLDNATENLAQASNNKEQLINDLFTLIAVSAKLHGFNPVKIIQCP